MAHASSVRVSRDAISALADRWAARRVQAPAWMNDVHLTSRDPERLLTYVIVLDSLNFCFWSHDKKWEFKYNGKSYSGYFGLALALKVWFMEHPERATFEYFENISFLEFKKIFQGGDRLLLLRKRWEIIRAVSRVMNKKYGGDPRTLVAKARGRFAVLVPLIARDLPSFNDTARYHVRSISHHNGSRPRKIFLLKRAQILAGDIGGILGGKGLGKFNDPGYLTAFPDYKLPQILEFFGIFEYAPALLKKIASRTEIRAGSQEEIELRAATVQAVEMLMAALRRRGVRLSPFQVDWLLWNESKRIKLPLPHHCTKTIFY